MINWLIYIILPGVTVLFFFINGYRNNLLAIFNLWWTGWVFVSILNPLNFYQVSSFTYLNICLSVLLLNVFFFFFKGKPIYIFKCINFHHKFRFNKFVELLYTFFLFYYILKMMSLIGSVDNYWKVRSYFFGLEVDGEVISLFDAPGYAHFLYLLKSFSLLNFLLGISLSRDKISPLFVMALFNISLYCALTSGRDVVFYALIYFVFYLRFGKVIYFKTSACVLLFFIFFMTSVRQSDMSLVLDAAISYFTGSIVFLDILLSQDERVFYYGGVTLSTVIPPLYSLFNLIVPAQSPLATLGAELSEFVRISDGSTFYDFYNALPTWYYFFYRDFGMVGWYLIPSCIVIFLTFIFNGLNKFLREHVVLISFLECCLLFGIFKPEVLSFSNILVVLAYIAFLRGGGCIR